MDSLERLWILACLQTQEQRETVTLFLDQRDMRIRELEAKINSLIEDQPPSNNRESGDGRP